MVEMRSVKKMTIINAGEINKRKSNSEFHFKCKNCSCEWEAERPEIKFTPPCFPYNVYMECPNCKKTVYIYE